MRASIIRIDQGRARADRKAAARAVEDVRERGPGTEDLDLAGKARPRVEPLEDRHVRVRAVFIRIDARIGRSARHLVVAGVREPHGVRHPRHAALVLVAVDLAVRRDRLPQKRKQLPAPHIRIVVPVLGLELRGRRPTATGLAVEQRWIRSREDFLPAHAIGDDENHVAGLAGPRSRSEAQRYTGNRANQWLVHDARSCSGSRHRRDLRRSDSSCRQRMRRRQIRTAS